MTNAIDLNCDMGEGLANDAELMPLISSANIACGFHAGDENTMKKTSSLAIPRPSYKLQVLWPLSILPI